MGNYYCCNTYEDYLPCSTDSKGGHVRRKLIKSMGQSTFKEVCVRTVQKFYDEEQRSSNQKMLRQSVAGFSHYENNTLSNCINEEAESPETQPRPTLPSLMDNLSAEKKEHYLLRLIMESYLFLDFSECVQNRQNYDKFMRHQLMQNDPSLDGSFIESTGIVSRLEEELKNFNPEMIRGLENYVKFCRKVKYDFSEEQGRFLSKLNLNLQSQVIQKYLNKQFRKTPALLKEMFLDIQAILKIMIVSIQTLYNFQLDTNQNISAEDEFFNSVNIYTMVTSILFQSQNFAFFIVNKIKQCFKHRFNVYSSEVEYSNSLFVRDFIALNSRESRRENRRSGVERGSLTYSDINLFPRSRMFLERIFRKSVPLFKLKMIYELSQEISKEQADLKRILYQKYNIQISNVFTGETQLLIIKWLLHNSSCRIDDITAHLLFTYQFVHRMHLLDKKGCLLLNFIQEIQRMLQWSCSS